MDEYGNEEIEFEFDIQKEEFGTTSALSGLRMGNVTDILVRVTREEKRRGRKVGSLRGADMVTADFDGRKGEHKRESLCIIIQLVGNCFGNQFIAHLH